MKPYLYALGAILCWASLPAATGGGLDGLSVPELLFFSFVPAAVYLSVQEMLLARRPRIPWPDMRLTLLGLAGIFGYHAIYFLAMDRAPLVEGAILATTWSFWIVVFSSALTRKRLSLPVLGVALLGLAGAGLVISGGKSLDFSSRYLPGYVLALTCGLIWSGFSVALSRLRPDRDYMPAFTVLAGGLFHSGLYRERAGRVASDRSSAFGPVSGPCAFEPVFFSLEPGRDHGQHDDHRLSDLPYTASGRVSYGSHQR